MLSYVLQWLWWTHLLAGQSSTRRWQRDGLKPEPGPLCILEICLLLNLLPVGHEQRLETNERGWSHTICIACTQYTVIKRTQRIDKFHLYFLCFFKAFQLAEPHILRLDPPPPLKQAAGGRKGGRLGSWGWWGSTGPMGWSCSSCFLHDSKKRQEHQPINNTKHDSFHCKLHLVK